MDMAYIFSRPKHSNDFHVVKNLYVKREFDTEKLDRNLFRFFLSTVSLVNARIECRIVPYSSIFLKKQKEKMN